VGQCHASTVRRAGPERSRELCSTDIPARVRNDEANHYDSEESDMSSRTYRVTEVVGTSPEGVDAAITSAIKRASRTLRHLDWFEVTQIRGHVVDNTVEHFQVTLKLGFRLEDDE
jgi:flavin-binding protein dodecin